MARASDPRLCGREPYGVPDGADLGDTDVVSQLPPNWGGFSSIGRALRPITAVRFVTPAPYRFGREPAPTTRPTALEGDCREFDLPPLEELRAIPLHAVEAWRRRVRRRRSVGAGPPDALRATRGPQS